MTYHRELWWASAPRVLVRRGNPVTVAGRAAEFVSRSDDSRVVWLIHTDPTGETYLGCELAADVKAATP